MASRNLIAAVDDVIEAYEEVIGGSANRTRQMLTRYGYVEALGRLVQSPDLQIGFRKLRDQGKLYLTFEAVVVKFAGEFKVGVVAAAQWRLDNAHDLL